MYFAVLINFIYVEQIIPFNHRQNASVASPTDFLFILVGS